MEYVIENKEEKEMEIIEEEKCENKLSDSSNCEDLTSRVGVALLFIVYYSWWRIQMQTENPCPFFFSHHHISTL